MKQLDFAPLRAARITQTEFAQILRVSRVSVSGWMRGAGGIHEMRLPRVARLLKVLAQATQDGHLPLPEMPRAARLVAIKKVLVRYLKTTNG